jgi:hypothetical protein
MTGYGIFYWIDGSRYEGYWNHSKKHGEGKITQKDGQVTEGLWEAGRKVN